ncbi:hypothetical protein ABPG72_018397 [Tetrahymena utriculariae]
MSKKQQTNLLIFNKIYQIGGEANHQEDLEFLQDIQVIDDAVFEKEVDSFLDTFFERQRFMKEINLKQLNQVFKPIINRIQSIVDTFCKRDDAPQFNSYFNSCDYTGRIIIKPQLNDFDLFVNKLQIKDNEIEQRKIDQVVIEIKNQNPNKKLEEKNLIQKPLDPLNKYQIQSIKKDGKFTVFKDDCMETWGVKETLYISQQSQNHSKKLSSQKYTQDLKEQLQFFKNNFISQENTWKRYKKNEWENMQFSKVYINLFDSLITFYHIPVHLLNALIGIPLKRVEQSRFTTLSQINQIINKLKLKREPQNYDLLIENLVQKFDNNQRIININIRSILFNQVANLQLNKQIYQEIQYLKLFLLLKTFEQCLTEVAGVEGLKEEFQQFLRDFKAFQIVKYFKHRIRNELQVNKNSICDCIYFIKKYNLPKGYESQYLKILDVFQEFQNLKPQKQEIIEYYNENNIKRSTYFWKLKYYWKNYQACLTLLDAVNDAIVNGPLGLVVIFSCKKKAYSKVVVSEVVNEEHHKTFSQMFREVKQQIEQNKKRHSNSQENAEDENDNGGIFGECCERFDCGFYIRNYFFLYFLKGIIICALFVFDYSNPRNQKDEQNLVYPNFSPIFQVLIVYPLFGLIKMIVSLFALIYCYSLDFVIYLRITQHKKYMEKLENFLPFPQKSNQIIQTFEKEKELDQLQIQILDYLQQLSNQDQMFFDQLFGILNIKKNDYKALSKYFLTQIFQNYVKSEAKTFNTVYHELTAFPRNKLQNLKDFYLDDINNYLEKNFCQTIYLFEDTDLNIQSILKKFSKWNNKPTYYK